MPNCNNKYVCLLAAWFLIFGCNLSATYAQSYGMPYSGSSPRRTPTPAVNCDAPNYEFRSTSGMTSVVGNSSLASSVTAPFADAPGGVICRTSEYNPWDEDGDPSGNGIGVVPIGEPLVLLFFAIFWLIFLRISKKSSKFAG